MSSLPEGTLRLGRLFESEFERQAHIRGHHVVRHCEQLGVTGEKAPMLTGPYAGYRLPDFSLLANGAMPWVEVKFKSQRTFSVKRQRLEHGIDLPNWRDYLAVCKLSGQAGFLVIGDGTTGDILIASFRFLQSDGGEAFEYPGPEHFKHGAIFWPVDVFKPWGRFDRRTGQMEFDFGTNFAPNVVAMKREA